MKNVNIYSPYDNKRVGTVPFSDQDDVIASINDAHNIFTNFRKRVPKYKIVDILCQTAQIISSQIEELTKLAASEGGKPYIDSKIEIERAINGIKYAASYLGEMGGKEIPMGHTKSSKNRVSYTMKEPIGVVAAISAFNHPFNLAVHQVIPAVAARCPVIIKPASKTPLSAFALIKILELAGLPKGYAKAIFCSQEDTTLLASSPKISFLSFIGSDKVGWDLRRKISNGTRIALEHGGVAPVIVEPDASLEELLPAILKGSFYHAGQVCVSVQRVYVHKSVVKGVAYEIANMARELKVGNPLDKKTEVGPLISSEENDRVEKWVQEAEQSGGEILCGGNKISNSCFEPTVILNPSDDVKVSTREVFGPVICIYSYDSIEEAIKRANALDVSFQAAIFTKNIDTALKATKELNATAVMINDHTAFRVDWMPFGGAKTSGLGLGGINYSIEEMSNQKLVVIKSKNI